MAEFGHEQRAMACVTGIRGLLDSRGIAGGNISMDDLNSAVRNQVEVSLERSDMLRELRGHGLRLVEGSATQREGTKPGRGHILARSVRMDRLLRETPKEFTARISTCDFHRTLRR